MKALTPAEREAVSRVKIYKTNPAASFRFLGVVKDEGCNQNEAMTRMKFQAVKLRANTVVDYQCRKRPGSTFLGCKNPVECSGSAVTIH